MSTPPRVPGYTVDGPLGFGSGGAVWSARDRSGTVVAVRLLPPVSRERDAARRRRLDVLRTIHHPGLAAVLDVIDMPDGGCAVVSEAVTGPSLATVRAGRRGLTTAEVLGVLRDLAASVATLHERGVVHGDVAPSNVVMATRGDVVRPVLADLAAEGAWEAGTPGFRAPEVEAGAPPGTAADVFALGALGVWAGSPTDQAALRTRLVSTTRHEEDRRPGAAELAAALDGTPTEAVRLPGASTLAAASMREQARREVTAVRRTGRPRRPRHRQHRSLPAVAAALLLGLALAIGAWGVGAAWRPTPTDHAARSSAPVPLERADVPVTAVAEAVRDLTARRDAALDAADAAALTAVSVPGSPMAERDAATLAAMRDAGIEVDGLTSRLDAIDVVDVAPSGAVVRVELGQAPHHRSWREGASFVSVPVVELPARCVELHLAAQAAGGWLVRDARACPG